MLIIDDRKDSGRQIAVEEKVARKSSSRLKGRGCTQIDMIWHDLVNQSTKLYCIVLYCIVLYCIALYGTVQYGITSYDTMLKTSLSYDMVHERV